MNTSGFVPTAQYSLLNSDGIDSFLMTATFDAAHTFLVHDARTPSASGASTGSNCAFTTDRGSSPSPEPGELHGEIRA